MDVSRDFYFYFLFSPNEQRARGGGGGGGTLPAFFFFFVLCSADHERDWPPCKVVFYGSATNALNVRNNYSVFVQYPCMTNNDIIHYTSILVYYLSKPLFLYVSMVLLSTVVLYS